MEWANWLVDFNGNAFGWINLNVNNIKTTIQNINDIANSSNVYNLDYNSYKSAVINKFGANKVINQGGYLLGIISSNGDIIKYTSTSVIGTLAINPNGIVAIIKL